MNTPEDKKRAVSDAYRLLAKQHHPDKQGGDDEAMKALNILHDAAEEAWDPDTVEPAADVYVEVDDDGQSHPDFRAHRSAVDTDDFGDEVPFVLDGVIFPRVISRNIRAMPAEEFAQW